MIQKLLRRPATRSNVPGVLRMSELRGTCDICNRHRLVGNHAACSRKRQAKYRHVWEAT